MLASSVHWGFQRMRVLLIAYHFPPDPAVGALRASHVAEALQAAGHAVTVITARLPGERGRWRPAASGLRVRPIRSLPTLRDLYAWAKRALRVRRRDQAETQSDRSTPDWPDRVPSWKRHLLSLLWFLDDRTGFVLPALLAALGQVRKGVDLVYTTVPPFSGHLVGLILRRVGGLRWAAEFRDPWTDQRGKPAHVRSRWSDAAERWLERQCLRAANHIVAVTDNTRDLLVAKGNGAGLAHKTIVVRNGIERLAAAPSTSRPAHRPFRIVHVGTFYDWRDPRPFFASLAAAVRTCGVRSGDVEVELIGDCRRYHGIAVEQLATDLGLADRVTFRDWVPHDVALQAIETADLLLLLNENQPAQAPTKMYEYLGARVPILAFTNEGSEVVHMLRRVGGHYLVIDRNPETAARLIADAIRNRGASQEAVGDETVLGTWTVERQMQQLCAALEG
jgi:glycosyltransferase involved in cell wall biosynthesis